MGDFKDNGELETQVDAKTEIDAQTRQVTSQIETGDEEVSQTYQESISVLDADAKHVPSIIIAQSESIHDLNCQQCGVRF